MPRPTGAADPLQVPWRPHGRILGDRVARRVVHQVRPFIDVGRPGLDRLGPLASLLQVGDAIRRQNPHDLLLGDPAQVLGHNQVCQIVDVGQAAAIENIHSNVAIGSE